MFSLRRFIFDAFLPAICVLGIAYNFLVALNGEEGIRAHAIVRDELAEKQQALADLKQEHALLERKTSQLSLKTLDADMLDESARRVLGYAGRGERVMSASEFDQFIKDLERGAP